MVIWVTGLSGAGKTTLCDALYRLLKPHVPGLVLLDGDALRAAVSHDLGYGEADRFTQISRIQRLAKLLSDQGLVVLVAALYNHPDLLAWNRQHLRGYVEIYLDVPLETVRRRDAKGLYANASTGGLSNVVGVDIPWHAPAAPDLVIRNEDPEPPDRLARRVAEAIPPVASLLEIGRGHG